MMKKDKMEQGGSRLIPDKFRHAVKVYLKRSGALLVILIMIGSSGCGTIAQRTAATPKVHMVDKPDALFPPPPVDASYAMLNINASALFKKNGSSLMLRICNQTHECFLFDGVDPTPLWFKVKPMRYHLAWETRTKTQDRYIFLDPVVGFMASEKEKIEIIIPYDTREFIRVVKRGLISENILQLLSSGKVLEATAQTLIAQPLDSAIRFLELLDEEKYVESWKQASITIPTKIRKLWVRLLMRKRLPLGRAESRQLKRDAYKWTDLYRRRDDILLKKGLKKTSVDFGFKSQFRGPKYREEFVRVTWTSKGWQVDAYRFE